MVRLRVSVGSPFAEVFLINHAFALVARSVGDFDATVEPGVYTVKVQLGNEVVERLIALFADVSLEFSGELRVASPAPLEATLRTHEFHAEHAASSSGTNWRGHKSQPALSAGSGAEIFLMARRWSSSEQGENPQAAASGTVPKLCLLRPDGELILDLAYAGEGRGHGFDPFLSRRVAVDPGAYLLRWQADAGVLAEQSVHAISDWQTQVFLLEDASGEAERRQLTILMGRPGDFRPDDPMLLQVEEARLALAHERKVASERVDEWLFAKFENPMLGLFGAHLMLIARDALQKSERQRQETEDKRVPAPVRFDQGVFNHMVHNLSDLLGPEHPDVAALSTQVSGNRLDVLAPVLMPPMLWRSWLLLIEASNDRPELVPVGTWRRAIRLLPLRPFLVWSPEQREATDEAEAVLQSWRREVGSMLATSTPPRQPARDVFAAGPATLEAATGSKPVDARRSLSLQMLAPRAAIDELDSMPWSPGEENS
jgi:hypothetical protein